MNTNTTTIKTETLNARVPTQIREELDAIATQQDRSRNWVIVQALKNYLDMQRWQMNIVEERVKDIKNGTAEFVSHEDVKVRQRDKLKKKLGL